MWFSVRAIFLRESEKNRCEKVFCYASEFFDHVQNFQSSLLLYTQFFSVEDVCVVAFENFLNHMNQKTVF